MQLSTLTRLVTFISLLTLLAFPAGGHTAELDGTGTLPFRTSVSDSADGWLVAVRERSSPAGREHTVEGSVWKLTGRGQRRMAENVQLPGGGELELHPVREGFLAASLDHELALDCEESGGGTRCWPVLTLAFYDHSGERQHRNTYSLKQSLPARLKKLGPAKVSDYRLDYAGDQYLLVLFTADTSTGREYCRVALYTGPETRPVQQLHSYCTALGNRRLAADTRRLLLNREQVLLGPLSGSTWYRAEPGQAQPLAGEPLRFDLVQRGLGGALSSNSAWRPDQVISRSGFLGRLLEGYPLSLKQDGTGRLLVRGPAGDLLVHWDDRGKLQTARRLPAGWHLAALSTPREWQRERPEILLHRTGPHGGLLLAGYAGGLRSWRLTRDRLREISLEREGEMRAVLDALTASRTPSRAPEAVTSPPPAARAPHSALPTAESTWLVHRPHAQAPATAYTVVGRTGSELRSVALEYPQEKELAERTAVPASTGRNRPATDRVERTLRERYREVLFVPLEEGSLQLLTPRAAFSMERGDLLLERDSSGEVTRVRRTVLSRLLRLAGMPDGSGGPPVHTGWSRTAGSSELIFRGPESHMWTCPVTGGDTVFGVCQRIATEAAGPVHPALFGPGQNPLMSYAAGMNSEQPVFLEGWTGNRNASGWNTALRPRPLARRGGELLGVLERPATASGTAGSSLLARWNRSGHLQAAQALPPGLGAMGGRGTEPDSLWFHRWETDGSYSLIGYHFNAAPAHSWVHYRAGEKVLQRVQPAELSRRFRRAVTGVYTPD